MTLMLHFPRSQASVLGALDPRWKLAAVFLAACALGLLREWELSVAGCLFALILVVLARIPARWYLVRMAGLVVFLLLFLLYPVVHGYGSEPTIDLGPITVAREPFFHLVGVLARAVGMVSLLLVHFATTPLPETFKAAHSLRMPGLLVQVLMLTYRYVFLLGEEFRRLRIALRVRGYRNRASLHSYRTVGQVSGTLLVRSLERAERVGQAMRARGFDGRFRSLHDFRTTGGDVAFFLVVMGVGAGLLAGQWWGGT